jgi:hypothetical protein
MRQLTIALAAVLISFSCNNSSDEKIVHTASTTQNVQASDENQRLIDELKKMGMILSSGDKNKIAELFPFPITDSAFGIYLGDNLQEDYKKNGNLITREMFLKHYSTFIQAQDLNGFRDIFKNLPLDSVTSKQPLFKERTIKGEPCIEFHKIEMRTDTVELQSGFSGLADPNSSDADVGCEYNSIWYFRFDGKKLRYLFHAVAG